VAVYKNDNIRLIKNTREEGATTVRRLKKMSGRTKALLRATIGIRELELHELSDSNALIELLSGPQIISKSGLAPNDVELAWGYLAKAKIRKELNNGEIWVMFDFTGRWVYISFDPKAPKKEWIWLRTTSSENSKSEKSVWVRDGKVFRQDPWTYGPEIFVPNDSKDLLKIMQTAMTLNYLRKLMLRPVSVATERRANELIDELSKMSVVSHPHVAAQ